MWTMRLPPEPTSSDRQFTQAASVNEVKPCSDSGASLPRSTAYSPGVPQHAQPVDPIFRQPVDAAADRFVVPPHEVVGRRAVPKIVFAGALPDKVLWSFRIDTKDPFTALGNRRKTALVGTLVTTLAEENCVVVTARFARHETNPKQAAIRSVTKPVNADRLACLPAKFSDDGHIGERIGGRGTLNGNRDFAKVVYYDCGRSRVEGDRRHSCSSERYW
jgi:hypothetical protein